MSRWGNGRRGPGRRGFAGLLAACWLALPGAAAAGETAAPVDAEALFREATAAYQAGEYAQAAKLYERIVAAGVQTADLYYNLGTAELRAGRRGRAVLALERALRLAPADADAAFNLAEAARGNIDKVVGAREEESLLERVGARIPVEPVGHAFLVAWLGGFGLLLLRRISPVLRGALGLAGGAALAAALLGGVLLAAAAWTREASRQAVVVAPSTPVREGPAADFKAAFEIHEGLKVRVLRSQGGFSRIRLPNGLEGWVASADVPAI